MRKVFLILTMAAPIVLGVATAAQASTVSSQERWAPEIVNSRSRSRRVIPGSVCRANGPTNITVTGTNDYVNDTLDGPDLDNARQVGRWLGRFSRALQRSPGPPHGQFDIDPRLG